MFLLCFLSRKLVPLCRSRLDYLREIFTNTWATLVHWVSKNSTHRNPPWSLPLFSWVISSDQFRKDLYYVLFPLKFPNSGDWFSCSMLWPMPFWSSRSFQRAVSEHLTGLYFVMLLWLPCIQHSLKLFLSAHWQHSCKLNGKKLPMHSSLSALHHPLSITWTPFPLLPHCLLLFLFLL